MRRGAADTARLRAWLEYVAEAAIDLLDELDAQGEDLEDDELGDDAARAAA
jgi:hypothetical protein